jgi:hypothetical protein
MVVDQAHGGIRIFRLGTSTDMDPNGSSNKELVCKKQVKN